ncbi:hypothetical protein BLGI_1631 [Brevibacillus laterosporus GI-9]|nr:hypothetical protein BLGI_1631 [Brevibacillus laterosporus GI-9]
MNRRFHTRQKSPFQSQIGLLGKGYDVCIFMLDRVCLL